LNDPKAARRHGGTMTRHLHLIEPRADGHRMQYVRRLIECAPADMALSLSTLPAALDHPATRAAIAAGGARLRVHAIEGGTVWESSLRRGDGFGQQPAFWRLLRAHWRRLAPAARGDEAVLPYLDYASYAIGLFGSPFGGTPWRGLVMRPDFHWREQGVVAPPARHAVLKRRLFLRLLRQRDLVRLVTIDPSLRDWIAKRRPPGHERLRYADDPADLRGAGGRAEARAHFGLGGGRVLLLFGSIDLRKGVRALLALAADPRWPADAQVLIVGRQSPEVKALVRERTAALPPACVVVADRFVDAQEEWLAFAAADFVWLAYEGFHGPSGVLAQCAQLGLTAIHRGEGLIGYHLRGAAALPWPLLDAHGLLAARVPTPAGPAQRLEQLLTP
jgi:hypothetical protein